jgi:hypothetical protein
MGYFKRKQTKKKGKRGTKKYRGGMSAVPAPNSGPEKETLKKELVTHFETLKSELDTLITDLTEANFETVKTHMDSISAKFLEYKKLVVPDPAM